ncbi:hypothetical protein HD806DRAFT_266865 [Xylariaceae sp. AK1471]|nr:hypothetical protein HD806DRAFT_266865 [Xylariaceae sp. AK1471]
MPRSRKRNKKSQAARVPMPANTTTPNNEEIQTPLQAIAAPESATKAYIKNKDTDAPSQRSVVVKWDNYMGEGALEDWQRLMKDLGFDETFRSKTQCKKALKTVWVNIPDFLHAIENGQPVRHFRNQWDLAKYTKKERRYYPKGQVEKGSPLRQLLAHIFTNQGGKAHGNHGLVAQMGGLMIAGV